MTVHPVQRSADTTIRLADATGDYGTLYRSTLWAGNPDELVARSGWNYFLIHSDGSHGFHDPSFAQAIMVGTYGVLEGAIDWTLAP